MARRGILEAVDPGDGGDAAGPGGGVLSLLDAPHHGSNHNVGRDGRWWVCWGCCWCGGGRTWWYCSWRRWGSHGWMVGARVLVLELVFVVGPQADRFFEEGYVLEGQRAGVLLVGQGESLRGAGGSRLVREQGDGQGSWILWSDLGEMASDRRAR